MRKIPGGTYIIGSPNDEIGRSGSVEQIHEVQVSTFWMGQFEVVQTLWDQVRADDGTFREFVGDRNPSRHNDCPSCPVENVTWYEALAFANALSRLGDLPACYTLQERPKYEPSERTDYDVSLAPDCAGYRLPTEAQWEVAARGGQIERTTFPAGGNLQSKKDHCDGDLTLTDGTLFDEQAWYCGNADGQTHAVGEKSGNGYGLYDMSGNVWEWVWDCHRSEYPNLTGLDPAHSCAYGGRILRGGSWIDRALIARSAYRDWGAPFRRFNSLGFRLARSAGGE